MTVRLENLVGALAMRVTDDIEDQGPEILDKTVSAPGSAITTIALHPGISIRWLSSALMLSHPGTVRLVDRLVAAELVERQAAQSDGRAVSLHLTAKGDTLAKQLLARRGDRIAALLQSLSESEKRQLEQIAEKLLVATYAGAATAVRTCRWCDGDACNDCPVDAAMGA